MDDWIRSDLKYIWHPYTQMRDCRKFAPILIERAAGIKLYDNRGNFYYDTISSWWCNVHGHNHPKIRRAICRQLKSLDHVLFAGFSHQGAIELAEKLVQITPDGLTKVFFSDNGSTAVEVALKMSFQYWQNIGKNKKQKFVCLDQAYHGDTLGAMSVSGVGLYNRVFRPLFFASYKVPSPYCYRCPLGKRQEDCNIECIEPLEKLLRRKSAEIAALVIEPMVLAAGGMIIYPARYLSQAAKLTRKYNVHLIADEVATGFGRTGKMFACEHAAVAPDFICLAKGITSGTLAQGVTLTTDKIFKAFYADYVKRKTFYHGHTYTANPLACAAALASLKIFEQEKTLLRLQQLTPLLIRGLAKLSELEFVGDARSIGLISAIELVKDKRTKQPFSFKQRIGLTVYRQGLKENLILRPLGNVIYLYLPLCIRPEQIKIILDKKIKVIKALSRVIN